MAKPWQPPTARLNTKVRSFMEVVRDMRHCVWSINRFRPDPPGQDKRFIASNLGSGFFVAPRIFLTCHHVVNSANNPHMTGDRYQLVQSLSDNTAISSLQFIPVVGTDLHLFPDRDAAILQLSDAERPYVSLGYSDISAGAEIGVAGYPLPRFLVDTNGNLQLVNLIYRVAKGVVTSTVRQSLSPTSETETVELKTIEVNFLFVPGNSGGPIFDAETGRVLAYVHGFMDSQIVQRYSDTNQEYITAGAPAKHIQALHAVYSLGIKLDAIRTELDGFGVTL
jgi:S1-C subfamily serine protease